MDRYDGAEEGIREDDLGGIDPEIRGQYTDEYGQLDRERFESDSKKLGSFMFRLHLFLSLAFILGGLALFGIGCFTLVNVHKDKKVCTVLTEGYVSGFDEDYADSSDHDSGKVFAPVFSYTYDGVEYTYTGSSYSDKVDFRAGQRVRIFVDPDSPTTVYIPEYRVEKRNAVLDIIIGLALAGGFIGYCFWQKRDVDKRFKRLVGAEDNERGEP
ncbi:MAG: DUF3592 domain-containing protein [Ruminococcus sp.]|nr:DUF3592 domain-containing protein [Ruminococcus sp.]